MTPHLLGGLKVPHLRGPQDLRSLAPLAIALAFVVAAGAFMTMLLPQETSRWMRLAVWVAPASLAFLARWWMTQRD